MPIHCLFIDVHLQAPPEIIQSHEQQEMACQDLITAICHQSNDPPATPISTREGPRSNGILVHQTFELVKERIGAFSAPMKSHELLSKPTLVAQPSILSGVPLCLSEARTVLMPPIE